MDFVETIRAVAALGVTLGLIGLAAFALRRYGPEWMTRLQATRTDRRLTLVESLPLDATRRLVLVRLDGTERLVLLGEGRILDDALPSSRPTAPRRPKSPPKAQGQR
jgi:flagellar protein FliO/FliZ